MISSVAGARRVETANPSDGGTDTVSVSATHVAVAIVAACRLRGVEPATVFARGCAENRQARLLAAAGLAARLGCAKTAIAPLLKVCAPELAPSMLARAGVTTDELLAIAEALEAAGLTGGDLPHDRFVKPWVAESESRPPVIPPADKPMPAEAASPQPAAVSAEPAHKPGARVESISGQSGRVRAGEGLQKGKKAQPDGAGEGPSPFKRRTIGLASAAGRARAREGEDRQALARQARSGVARLKAVTDRIAGWAAHFLEAGWDRFEVAELFDVCPDALLNALDPAEAMA